MLTAEGIAWTASKRMKGKPTRRVLIEWSRELQDTINEALKCPRRKDVGTFYVFGNLAGHVYTKGGWKANLTRLMDRCKKDAAEQGKAFNAFSLQECRPKAVFDTLDNNGGNLAAVMNATQHTDARMIRRHYDRRTMARAAPVGASGNSKVGISKDKRGNQ
jgi:hypothetical protein